MRAILPSARRPPFEIGGLGRIRKRFTRGKQRSNIDAIVGLNFGSHMHSPLSLLFCTGRIELKPRLIFPQLRSDRPAPW
jgi:hypothetical protein